MITSMTTKKVLFSGNVSKNQWKNDSLSMEIIEQLRGMESVVSDLMTVN